ncbi:MAG TPA: DNA-3-methyladenine glycosylase [Actinomycetota bacterium]|nr:DNA-3-methyladenine glycosylase [Actinomycetota bacterium]
MRLGPRLARGFYARPATEVAPELLGRFLVRRLPDGERLTVRLVEVEAYEPDDPASHSFRGRSRRNTVMFGPPGRMYVYFTYGMHLCANVVTGTEGIGSAVLLRAAEPLEGLGSMSGRRGLDDPLRLCSGPGRLTQALDIGRSHDGVDLVRDGEVFMTVGAPVPPSRWSRTTRVGVSLGADRRWRWFERGSAFVSGGRPSVPGRAVRG